MKKTIITFVRTYKKEVAFTLPSETTEGLSYNEITDLLTSGDFQIPDDYIEDEFESTEEEFIRDSGGRYDVYDEQGNHVWGGHL